MKFEHVLTRRSEALKIAGIVIASLTVLASYLFPRLRPADIHVEIMFWCIVLVIVLCAWLLHDLTRLVQRQGAQIERLMGVNLALTSLIDLKDHYTEGHSRNVGELSRGFAEHLGLPRSQVEEIALAALLHDIGKIGIPDTILKKPGPLTEAEFAKVKRHAGLGASAIEPIEDYRNVVQVIKHHHERFDGTGYPDGLAGDRIPEGARLIALADTFDALVHGRAYRRAKTVTDALEMIQQQKGGQFDPILTDAFLEFIRNGADVLMRHDPVCGMVLKDNTLHTTYAGDVFYFCSQTCLQEFSKRPARYAISHLNT